jgi:hypothetical protein
LVDEALCLTIVVETTRDTFTAVRKHLDSLSVPLLTPGSGGLVEESDSFVPPLNQMLIRESRVSIALLGTEILSVEGVELGHKHKTERLSYSTFA